MRPIRLHLDSSDHAAMHRAVPGTPQAIVRDDLKRMVASGLLEIGVSYHVIFELLQKHRFSAEGLWQPCINLEEIDIENVVRNVLKSLAQRPGLSRRERRMLAKRRNFADWVRANPDESTLLFVEQWPLLFGRPFVDSGNLRRYIPGEIGRGEANNELRFYITDPVAVYHSWFENYGRDNPIVDRRDQIADKLLVMIKQLTGMLDETERLQAVLREAIATTGANALAGEEREKLLRLNGS